MGLQQNSFLKMEQLIKEYPPLRGFLENMNLPLDKITLLPEEYFRSLDSFVLEETGLGRVELQDLFQSYLQHLQMIKEDQGSIGSLTLWGGQDKAGKPEEVHLHIQRGEIVCLVGPTGSGKSRLLEDIEWLAQQDTVTRRKVTIDGNVPREELRFSSGRKLVAQLSQNMNFVMDVTVYEFLKMHAESRLMKNIEELVDIVVEQANLLTGESFGKDVPVTSLSGGQSRALMIADTAALSVAPVVLIDEIENAGINRSKALELLVSRDKIVFIATHDPILALMGHKRLVMKNGGMIKVLERSEKELEALEKLQMIDRKINEARQLLREGAKLESLF